MIIFHIIDDDSSALSQQASGACNTSQLPLDRLVQSLTGAAAQTQFVNSTPYIMFQTVLSLPQEFWCAAKECKSATGSHWLGQLSIGSVKHQKG